MKPLPSTHHSRLDSFVVAWYAVYATLNHSAECAQKKCACRFDPYNGLGHPDDDILTKAAYALGNLLRAAAGVCESQCKASIFIFINASSALMLLLTP